MPYADILPDCLFGQQPANCQVSHLQVASSPSFFSPCFPLSIFGADFGRRRPCGRAGNAVEAARAAEPRTMKLMEQAGHYRCLLWVQLMHCSNIVEANLSTLPNSGVETPRERLNHSQERRSSLDSAFLFDGIVSKSV
jgi:hypothetical protein